VELLRRIVSNFKGVLCLCLLVIYTLLGLAPVMLIALVKWLVPNVEVKKQCTHAVVMLAEYLVYAYKLTFEIVHQPQWDVEGLDGLSPQKSYLIIANHQAWSDIPILVFLLMGRVPFFKFFLKKELIWLPLIGIACWALDFPFMRRHSKEELANNPQWRGKDLETTRELCKKLGAEPVSIVNFIEGTRFTLKKKVRQTSPYQHLLKPKSGGVAYVVSMLGDNLAAVVDMSIIYPDGPQNFWQFLSGQLKKVVVRVNQRTIPPQLREGDYQASDEYREDFQQWVASLWLEKDALIELTLTQPVTK